MDGFRDSILGLAGVVLTAVVTAFKDEIGLALRLKLGANKDLEGHWACKWTTRPAEGEAEPPAVEDVVEIERVAGAKVKALGGNPLSGSYKLSGTLLKSSVLLFSWTGDGKKKEVLGGVAVLELNTMRDEMTGQWSQVTAKRTFVGGDVRWTKQ
jgi:hypothetical protein